MKAKTHFVLHEIFKVSESQTAATQTLVKVSVKQQCTPNKLVTFSLPKAIYLLYIHTHTHTHTHNVTGA